MTKIKTVAPVLKWVGGKRQLLNKLTPLLPAHIETYCEPFIGGGAVLFHLQPNDIYINDINDELIRVYSVIKNDVDSLVSTLSEFTNDEETFYAVRDWDRDAKKYATLTDLNKAARILFLNKTCFNGLFRVNKSGQFNAPFGKYSKPSIVNEKGLRAVSEYLNKASVHITCTDFEDVLLTLPNDKNTFVYLDPPYDPVSDTSSFTGYAKGGFNRNEQLRLKACCDNLNARGIKFMLSNSSTDFIKDIYSQYNITVVKAKRAINTVATRRGDVDEVVVRNYE